MGVMLTGKVYSGHKGVNVIIPGTGYRGEGNHLFGPANKPVTDYIRECIADAIVDESTIGDEHRARPKSEMRPENGYGMGKWAKEPFTTYLFEEARGEYRFTIYQD